MTFEDKVFDAVADLDPFPPKPGGLIDQHRKAEAVRKAAAEDQEHAAQDISERAYKAAKVANVMPEYGSTRTIVVSQSGGIQQLLGANPLRRRATIMTFDEPIVVAPDLASASDSNNVVVGTVGANVNASGLLWPVNVPLVLEDRHEWFVVAASATSTRVSVVTESYAPETLS